MKTVKLGDVCLKITDGSHYSPKPSDITVFPYVTVRDISNDQIDFDGCKRIDKRQFEDLVNNGCMPSKGDLLFSKDGTVGKVSLVNFDKDFVVLSSLAILRPNQNVILPEYLFHILKSPLFLEQAIGKKSGTAIRRIILRDLKNIEFNIEEDINEQRRVVERLDAAFEKIDRAIELTEKNINNVQILFSKLIEQEIDKTKDYSIVELGEVCEFVRGPFGGSLRKELFKPTGYAVYEQRHAIYGDFRLVRYHIDAIKFSEMKRFEIKPGDVIMSCSGTMGKTSLVPDGIEPGVINQALLKLSPKRDRLLASYLKYWMESRSFQDLLGINSGGAAIKNVASVKILKAISMRLPPIRVQEHIVHSIGALQKRESDMGELYGKKHEALHSLKQSLLTQAFSQGEVE